MKSALALGFLMAATCALAQQSQIINVNGDAEIEVQPDRVVLSLGVEVRAKTLEEARAENDRRVRGVRAAAAKLGVAPGDVQTDFIQLGMAYEVDGITIKYYYSRKSIVIVLRDVDRMEETLATFRRKIE